MGRCRMGNLFLACWKLLCGGRNSGHGGGCFERDGREYSVAVVQANQVLEDQFHLEFGSSVAFVGVYDGHGGPEASQFLRDRFFNNFQAISADKKGVVTTEMLKKAFLLTEREFTDDVSQLWKMRPNLATVGSCCLIGVISQQTLFVANVGDSRAVLGKKVGSAGHIAAVQLSTEHNANIEEIRQELKELHPNDPQIVVLKHGVWRVKGVIQVSRSIGDVYLKHARYNEEPINGKLRLSGPFKKPVMSSTPSVISYPLEPNDLFLIFASDGLWDHLSNEEAVDIVRNHPHAGSAKRLVNAALQEAARKCELQYSDLQKIDLKVRRHFHDDITVIVLFLNHDLISRGMAHVPPLSVHCPLELV